MYKILIIQLNYAEELHSVVYLQSRYLCIEETTNVQLV